MFKKITIITVLAVIVITGLITLKNVHKRYLKFKDRVVNIEDRIKNLEIENVKAQHEIDVLYTKPYNKKEYSFNKFKINVQLDMFHTPYQTKITKLDKKTSYILEYGDKIIIFFQSGKIVYFSLDDLINHKVMFYEIENNIYNDLVKDNELFYGVKNILLNGDELLLSYTEVENSKSNDKNYTGQCYKTSILKSKMNIKKMEFKKFFDLGDCIKRPSRDNDDYSWGLYSQGGKMIHYKDNSILMTVGEYGRSKKNNVSQDDKRPFGKIIKINLDTKEFEIFSKGHRNPQGLYWDKVTDTLIENEHGPTGGDEINVIKKGKNYGATTTWYGEQEGELAKKSHSELGFEEPLTHFIPAIAPSGIYKASGNDELDKKNYFFMSTLRAASLYLVEFSKDYKKVNDIDYIEIGERIRHMIYIKSKNLYLLVLDSTPGIGVMTFN